MYELEQALNQLTTQEIRQRLAQATGPAATRDLPAHLHTSHKQCRQAGVLVPFVRIQASWHLLFIRRADLPGDRHSGQVAFAGGKHEPQDKDLTATALREAREELGINPEDVTVLGHLNKHHSISNFSITPVIGTLPWPYPLQLQTSEVGRAFTIPLHWLADPANRHQQHRLVNNQYNVAVDYYKEYGGEILWGATARMTLSLIDRLCGDSAILAA